MTDRNESLELVHAVVLEEPVAAVTSKSRSRSTKKLVDANERLDKPAQFKSIFVNRSWNTHIN